MRRNPKRYPADAVLAWPLEWPKDEFEGTISLTEFLAGKCPFHQFGCGDAAAHRREFTAHADAYDAVDGRQELRHEPRVAFGGTGGTHIVYWKVDRCGLTYRSGRVRDLLHFTDYTAES